MSPGVNGIPWSTQAAATRVGPGQSDEHGVDGADPVGGDVVLRIFGEVDFDKIAGAVK